MRPVNLLPAGQRARSGGGKQGSSYVALGVLGALLVAVVFYVLSGNSVTDKKNELAKLQQETSEAQAKAAASASYANFAQIKQQRLESVKDLAQQRFDWERMSREIAHVLPAGVDLTGLEASVSGLGSNSPGASQQAANGGQTEAPQPQVKLSGCATGHPAVADTLVRLRRLHRADDVTLSESAATESKDTGESAASGTTCGGKQSYAFQASVKFAAEEPETGATVPAKLGGGS